MSMRVFHRAPMRVDEIVTLEADESHYLARVRRARVGARVDVLDGTVHAFTGEVLELDSNAAKIRIVAAIDRVAPPPIEIAIGVPDPGATLEAIARACELGATRAVLVRCTHSHAREPSPPRMLRVIEAAQRQCGRPDPIVVEGPLPLLTWLQRPTDAVGWVATTQLRGRPSTVDALGPKGARVLVGPEGGLTEVEIEQARAHALSPISLGPWILRTEVAVVAALTRILHGSGHGRGDANGHGAGEGDAR